MSNRVHELMVSLAACLCEQAAEDGSPEMCFCGVLPGDTVVADYVGEGCSDSVCGMAWVRLITAYPASGVGVVNENIGNCGSQLGIEIEIGMLRCFPAPEDDGEPPAKEEMLAASAQQTDDMFTMLKAISCCDSLSSKDYVLSAYTPAGPMGLVYGGTFTVMLAT
jgi:hypothetical protein